MLVKLDDELDECSAYFVDVLFLDLPSNDVLEVLVHVVEDAVKVVLILDYFLDACDVFDFGMVHE